MSYNYASQKHRILTDEGQRNFLKVRDFVFACIEKAGAVRMQEAMAVSHAGDTWADMATVDRMVELGEIVEVTSTDSQARPAGQHRIFTRYDR